MLKLGALFHLNLMYSSLRVEDRPEVVRRCYHPLLDLAEEAAPVAIEATGLTLEILEDLDPGWLRRMRALMEAGRVEFIGSGYAQIIGPLVPAEVNAQNLRLGTEVYERLVDIRPDVWLINEMAWSGGLPELYLETGARAVVMEWNNPWRGHPEWDAELRYHHQMAAGSGIPILWVDTIDFQKTQRLARGEMSPTSFREHWQAKAAGPRYAAWYGSDAEVFDFRPGRYADERAGEPEGEWARMRAGLEALDRTPGVELVPFTAALEEPASEFCGRPLRLESTAQPVVVKKQEKYNLNRWAVTGRDDLGINTRCHAIYRAMGDSATDDQWRTLCRLWSSDFRTHITEDRWREFEAELAALPGENGPGPATSLSDSVICELDPARGMAIRKLVFPAFGDRPVLGTLPHGHFDDIGLGADFYSGHVVVQYPGRPKLTDLVATEEGKVIRNGDLEVTKEIAALADGTGIVLRGSLELPARRIGEVHPVHLTAIPGFFEEASLAFAVRNGGRRLETFPLTGEEVHHGAAYSTLITAKGGLGATDGVVMIGDAHRRLVLTHDPAISALMPTIRFTPVRTGGYFLRVRYSAQEVDETFVENDEPWRVAWSLTIVMEDRPIHEPSEAT